MNVAERIKLRGTDLEVSRLCLGTMTFGDQADASTSRSIVDLCLERGIDFIDTANMYAKGGSESLLGEILARRRDQVVLASKVGVRMGNAPEEGGLSARAIEHGIEASLERLKTDYLDVYYLHLPDHDVPLEESLRAMDDLVRKGKVRHIAISNYASWEACRLLWLAEKHSLHAARITQPMYNLIARGIEQEFLPMCVALGLSTIVYNPLAGGLLTGKHRERRAVAGSRFDGNEMYLDRYWHDANFDAVDELARTCESQGRSLISASFAWLLHHTRADGLILGASKLEQLEQNLDAISEGPLSPDLLAACEALWEGVRQIAPKYNR